jgi:hypothetical protein
VNWTALEVHFPGPVLFHPLKVIGTLYERTLQKWMLWKIAHWKRFLEETHLRNLTSVPIATTASIARILIWSTLSWRTCCTDEAWLMKTRRRKNMMHKDHA